MVGITVPTVVRSPPSRRVRAIESAPSRSKSAGVKGGPSSTQHHAQARVGELLGDDGAAGTRAHHHDVRLLANLAVVVGEDAQIDVGDCAHRAPLPR